METPERAAYRAYMAAAGAAKLALRKLRSTPGHDAVEAYVAAKGERAAAWAAFAESRVSMDPFR